MITSRSTKTQSIVDWKIMINFSSFPFFNPTNTIESNPWYCRDLLTSKTSYTGAWCNWAISYISKHTAQAFQDPLSERYTFLCHPRQWVENIFQLWWVNLFPNLNYTKLLAWSITTQGETSLLAKNMQFCFIFIDEVKGYLKTNKQTNNFFWKEDSPSFTSHLLLNFPQQKIFLRQTPWNTASKSSAGFEIHHENRKYI